MILGEGNSKKPNKKWKKVTEAKWMGRKKKHLP
jgi:hypothetical protein